MAPGLYVVVLDGLINVKNSGGAQLFSAGQFGYVRASNMPPVLAPTNPALKFTPPPPFSQSVTSGKSAAASTANQVDCEVR